MQGKDILDEDSAVSYMQMTSYRISVCYATKHSSCWNTTPKTPNIL